MYMFVCIRIYMHSLTVNCCTVILATSGLSQHAYIHTYIHTYVNSTIHTYMQTAETNVRICPRTLA